MPEEIELNPHEQQESVEGHLRQGKGKEPEHQQGWIRYIALSTALLAVIASVAALQAGALVDEALLHQSGAVQKQAEASNEWAYYQAKGIKSAIAAQTAVLLSTTAKSESAAKYHAESVRYQSEQKALSEKAKELEKERDAKSRDSEEQMHHHHTFAYCVTLTQIAIALSAIVALTRRPTVWYLSLGVGGLGLLLLLFGFLNHG